MVTFTCIEGLRESYPHYNALLDGLRDLAHETLPHYESKKPQWYHGLEGKLEPAAIQAFRDLSKDEKALILRQMSTLQETTSVKNVEKEKECLFNWTQFFSASTAFQSAINEAPSLITPPSELRFEVDPKSKMQTIFSIDRESKIEHVPAKPLDSYLVLEIISGPHKGQSIKLSPDQSIKIGRKKSKHDELRLSLSQEATISPDHCSIRFSPPHCRLRNRSRNGTLLNGQSIDRESPIVDGDQLILGESEIIVHFEGPLEPDQTLQEKKSAGGSTELLQLQPFNGLEVVSLIDKGGMGEVYLAQHIESGQLIAIKTMRPELASCQENILSFLREIRLGAKLKHPHGTRIFDGGYEGGVYYFLMEYVNGQNVHNLISQRGQPLQVREALRYILQILGVIEEAHALGFVHRDIKPQNVMITTAENNITEAKLLDFGLMRSYENHHLSLISKTGEMKGTPSYMPPEQVKNAKHVGPTADLYSLAATLYFMVTGRSPIPYRNDVDFIDKILNETPNSPRLYCPEIPPALETIILVCLAKDPDLRYQSAAELRQQLEKISF
ncbi:MAG: serine/threonine-protein kinase [Planctomycetota bacterium]|nr:serine/threonine-protein kinase [Planctomycetota bacterium]